MRIVMPDVRLPQLLNYGKKTNINFEVKDRNTTNKTWDDFVIRKRRNIWSVPRNYIDKLLPVCRCV